MSQKHKIVLVPFPYSEKQTTKIRPALKLSKPIGEHKLVILAFITTNLDQEKTEFDIELDRENPSFKETGLKQSSTIKLHRIVAMPESMIINEIGYLPKEQTKQLYQKLTRLLIQK